MACIEGEGWCNTGRLPRWPIARPTGLLRGMGNPCRQRLEATRAPPADPAICAASVQLAGSAAGATRCYSRTAAPSLAGPLSSRVSRLPRCQPGCGAVHSHQAPSVSAGINAARFACSARTSSRICSDVAPAMRAARRVWVSCAGGPGGRPPHADGLRPFPAEDGTVKASAPISPAREHVREAFKPKVDHVGVRAMNHGLQYYAPEPLHAAQMKPLFCAGLQHRSQTERFGGIA